MRQADTDAFEQSVIKRPWRLRDGLCVVVVTGSPDPPASQAQVIDLTDR